MGPAVQRGIWVPTQHLLWDQGKPWKTLMQRRIVRSLVLYGFGAVSKKVGDYFSLLQNDSISK
jgi:hypothetical protein